MAKIALDAVLWFVAMAALVIAVLLMDRVSKLEAGLAMAEATIDVMAQTDNELIDQGFMFVELIDERAELVDERFGPMAATWWAEHCFGKGPGELPRNAYDNCTLVYQWMVDAEFGPFAREED